MSDSVISFRDASFSIGSRPIVRGVSLDVAAGETLVLLGRSGAGKTSVLRMVNGLVLPSSGEVIVNGKSTKEWDSVRLKRSIGYVIQESGLFPHYTVARNIGLVPWLEEWPEDRIRSRVSELLERVGLTDPSFGGRHPRELSGGQRQRVGVARALAAHPSILLLDEPFGALDPLTRSELQTEFLHWAEGKTALFVTHDVFEAMRVGKRIAVFDDGRLVFIGTPDEFLRSDQPLVQPLAKLVLNPGGPHA